MMKFYSRVEIIEELKEINICGMQEPLSKSIVIKYYLYLLKLCLKKQGKRNDKVVNSEYDSGVYMKSLEYPEKINDLRDILFLEYDKFVTDEKIGYVFDDKFYEISNKGFVIELEKELHNWINKFVEKDESLTELGCGQGKHIILLRDSGFKGKLFGCDISKNAIEFANNINKKFGTNILFECLDMTKPLPQKFSGTTIFTHTALEQTKHYNEKIIVNLINLKPKQVMHFEDFYELYPINLRTIGCRLYSYARDYQTNLFSILKKYEQKKKIRILDVEKLRINSPFSVRGVMRWIPL